jgi:hypothetical protein
MASRRTVKLLGTFRSGALPGRAMSTMFLGPSARIGRYAAGAVVLGAALYTADQKYGGYLKTLKSLS